MRGLILNPFFSYIIFNIIILVLYVFKLSNLYNPTYEFSGYYISILLWFIILSFRYIYSHRYYLKNCDNIINIGSKRKFICVTLIFFFIGFLANIYQIMNGELQILAQNKVSRSGGDHYVQYLVNLLMMTSMLSYIGIKNFKSKSKILMYIILILSILSLVVWLNRGAFTLFLLTVIIYEYIIAVKNNTVTKMIRYLFIYMLIFIIFFGYIGDLRVEYVMNEIFKHTINEHYGMSELYPTSFVWVYTYLTSPLENISQIISFQSVSEYKLGTRMLYPFVAPIAKMYFDTPTNLYPPLESIAGLNVSTFIVDALTDFGYIGPYIYMVYLLLILRIGQLSLTKGIYGFLCYVSAFNISLWLLFVNAFSVGPFMLTYLIFAVLGWCKSVKL